MHSKVKPLSISTVPETYPCMKEHISGMVVLFTEPKAGVFLGGGTGYTNFAYYTDEWCENEFEPFHGEITIFTEN